MNLTSDPSPFVQSDAKAGESDAFARASAELDARLPSHARFRQIVRHLQSNQVKLARKALQERLVEQPGDADALCLLAYAELRLGHFRKAAALFARYLEIAPISVLARFHYAKALCQLHDYAAAQTEVDQLLVLDSRNSLYRHLKASVLAALGENEQAAAICEQLTVENPGRPQFWIMYGDALRRLGLQEKSVAAYRKAIGCCPWFGLAWWKLADMKTFRFDSADIVAMDRQLNRAELGKLDRVHLLFALGKAHEDLGAYERSIAAYAKANALLRLDNAKKSMPARSATVNNSVFTTEFFRIWDGSGCTSAAPIFVLGRPRSGSTLIEQILSSHSQIEGTAELPYISDLVDYLEESCGRPYPGALEHFDASSLAALGREYLRKAQVHRKLNRPFFIDKTPDNYRYVGLIRLILPRSKIIDARRNPAASCLSLFKQTYPGSGLSLAELGRVYREYVEMMSHFDRVLPGRIHRVIYEELVTDPEDEIRKLIDYLELPFEEKCLYFYKSGRAVRSPSSEQVRRPIFRDAVEYWRNFEPWLKPLLSSLGSALTDYPDVPAELKSN